MIVTVARQPDFPFAADDPWREATCITVPAGGCSAVSVVACASFEGNELTVPLSAYTR